MSVFTYNTDSINYYVEEDYGSISSAAVVTDDYQAFNTLSAQSSNQIQYGVQALYDPQYSSTSFTIDDTSLTSDGDLFQAEDFGYFFLTETVFPFGSMTSSGGLTGEAVTAHYTAPAPPLPLAGNALVNLVKTWAGNGTLFEIGSGLERTVKPYIASGTLRLDKTVAETALESFTFDYNESSLFYVNGGLISDAIDIAEDYGNISDPVSGNIQREEDYGLITDIPSPAEGATDPLVPLVGGFTFQTQTGPALFTANITGSGVLGTFYGAASNEQVSFAPTLDTTLFTLSGELVPPDIRFIPNYPGSGTLFGFGVLGERVTYDYNESSVSRPSEDYGSVVGIPQIPTVDYGFVYEDYGAFSEQYGEVTDGEGSTNPFGIITLSGTGFESYTPTIFTDTILFEYSGIASTKLNRTFRYSGISTEITLSGELTHPDIDYTPHYGIEKNIGIGTTGIQFSETSAAVERVVFDPSENTTLFEFVGIVTADKRVVYNTPENTQLITLSGTASEINVNVAIENTILFGVTGIATEKVVADIPERTVDIVISGIASCAEIQNYGYYGDDRDPGTSGTLTISGTPLVVRLIPHYGIEQNIGIGTTGIQFQVGVGTFPDGDGNPRDAKTYSNRYGFQIGDFNFGSGIGTIFFGDAARTRALLPYFGDSGPINVLGTGNEAYARTTYIASGSLTILGDGDTAPIQVYGYYGDDRDPGTSGFITISTQTKPIIEIEVDSYVGSGQITVSGTAEPILRSFGYDGSGSINVASGASESRVIETLDDTLTVLYNIVGTAEESESEAIIGDTVLYNFAGAAVERQTDDYAGSGSILISGVSSTFFIPKYSGTGTFRFVSYLADNTYDTCDNENITTDYESSANVRFVANPPEDTVLYDILGSAETAETSLSVFVGVGIGNISGSVSDIKLTSVEVGGGTLLTISSVVESESNSYVGSGSISFSSGGEESISAQTPESTVTFNILGSSETRVESEYTAVGIGLFNFSNSASTAQIQVYTTISSGLFTIYGEVVEPDVAFIPAFKARGTFSILGSAEESVTRIYQDTSGSLFKLAGGLESFSPTGYIGVGTIYTISTSALTINNPFQIPRTYTVII